MEGPEFKVGTGDDFCVKSLVFELCKSGLLLGFALPGALKAEPERVLLRPILELPKVAAAMSLAPLNTWVVFGIEDGDPNVELVSPF